MVSIDIGYTVLCDNEVVITTLAKLPKSARYDCTGEDIGTGEGYDIYWSDEGTAYAVPERSNGWNYEGYSTGEDCTGYAEMWDYNPYTI